MKMHSCHSNVQFKALFAMKLSINVAQVSNYSPDIIYFNLQQGNTVSRKKILFTQITVIFQQGYIWVLHTAVLK